MRMVCTNSHYNRRRILLVYHYRLAWAELCIDKATYDHPDFQRTTKSDEMVGGKSLIFAHLRSQANDEVQ
jgi:hypothetical protein